VYSGDAVTAGLRCVVERITGNTLRRLPGDELDGLNNTIDNFVLDTRVLALRVLTDENSVDIIIRRLVALDRHAGTNVGEKVESAAQGKVEGNVALAD
jgi:hypothetical protein